MKDPREVVAALEETETSPASNLGAKTVQLSEVVPRKIGWLWKGRIPRATITQLDGDPDLAKSTIVLDLAARISRGREFPDGQPCEGDPMTTLLLSAEDPAETVIRPRFDAAGGDPEMVTLLQSVRRKPGDAPDLFALATDIAILEETARKIARLALIAIDPLTAYLGAVNSWKDQEVRRVLAPLAALAERLDIAVLLIRHLNKATKLESVLYRGGGSIGIIGAARSGLLAAKDPDDPERRLLATYKHNLARGAETLAYRTIPSPRDPEVPLIEWLGADPRSAEQINAAGAESFEEKTARGDARHFLKELLANEPLTAEAVYTEAKKIGIAVKTIKRASADLGVKKAKTGFRTGWTWSLP